MPKCIEVVEGVFRGEYDVEVPPRIMQRLPQFEAMWMFMPGYSRTKNLIVVKLVSEYVRNPENFGLSKASGLVVLIDARNGQLLALMDSVALTSIRTGAASGVATKFLSRPESEKVGVIGSGEQARTQLLAISNVRRIGKAWVYSTNPSKRQHYAATMTKSLGVDVSSVSSAREAIQDADIVITATNSSSPVINGDDIKIGTHINSIGALPYRRELDEKTIMRSKIFVDTLDGVLREAGDIMHFLKELEPARSNAFTALSSVVTGKSQGRRSKDEITLFKSVGFAALDLAAASSAFTEAERMNLGREIFLTE